jgi:cytochrome P450
MMAKQAAAPTRMRDRDVPAGALVLISPWNLQRHERLWDDPHVFDPERWETENGKACARDAFIPFSAGPRVCVGAGFAMAEGALLLAEVLRAVRLSPVEGRVPRPVTQLTVRSEDGIWLRLSPVKR